LEGLCEARVPWKGCFFKEGLFFQGRVVFSRKGCFFKEGLCEARVPWKAFPALLRTLEGACPLQGLCEKKKHVSLEGVSRKGNQEQKIDYVL